MRKFRVITVLLLVMIMLVGCGSTTKTTDTTDTESEVDKELELEELDPTPSDSIAEQFSKDMESKGYEVEEQTWSRPDETYEKIIYAINEDESISISAFFMDSEEAANNTYGQYRSMLKEGFDEEKDAKVEEVEGEKYIVNSEYFYETVKKGKIVYYLTANSDVAEDARTLLEGLEY